MIYAGFIFCALVIFFAGSKLSYYGDLLAEKTGWGKAWVGLILLSAVTTLPELMSGISAAAIVQSPDLAVGNVIGSCAFNLFILAIMDVFVINKKPLIGSASQNHILAAALALILITLTGIGIILPDNITIMEGIGITSIFFIVIYIVSIRLIYQHNRNHPISNEEESNHRKSITLIAVIFRYILFALIIIAAALFLPYFADQIAEQTGLGKSFVGTLFLAVSTSLPEIAVSYSAIRMGAIDLSVGNVLGSNIFNILILSIDDIFYTNGNILKEASETNLISIFSVIIMTAVAIIGLTYRSSTKRFLLAWDAFIIFIIYIINMLLLYKLS